MNQRDLVKAVAEKADISQAVAKNAINAFLDSVSGELADGGEVRLKGFGTFGVKPRAERVISGPIGRGKTVPAHNAPVFKASQELKDQVR